jgi:hypothetical protein
MKYAVDMGSVAMIYVPSFIKIGSGIQKLIREDTQTHRQDGDRISLLQESRLKMAPEPLDWVTSAARILGSRVHGHICVVLCKLRPDEVPIRLPSAQ